jgi:hypothetical protein
MILLYVKRTVQVVAAAGACYVLAESFGPSIALLLWGGIAAVGCCVGTVLLRTSEVGEISWRNRAAGYLIPWGWRLNRGALWPVPLLSWVVWMAIGAAAVLLWPATAEDGPGVWVRIALFGSWVVDAAALVSLLGTIRQATPGSRVGSLWKLVAVITLLIGASVGLYVGGLTTAALVLGGGPPAFVGGCAGLIALVFMTVGRNTRWN